MNWRGQGVWVLGAGFLGSALASALRAAGAAVLTVDCSAPADLRADATDVHVLAAGIGRVVPRVAFCCLSTRGGDAACYHHAYVKSLQTLLSIAPAVRPIFCSSVSLYPDTGGEAVDECTPLSLYNARQEALLRAEQLVHVAGGAVVRLAALYGPGRCELLRRHLAGSARLPGKDERWLNYLHVDDAVRSMLEIASTGQKGVYNLCSESFTHAAVYELLAQLTGKPASATCSDVTTRGSANHRITSCRFRMLNPHRLHDFVLEEMQRPTLS